MHTFHFKTSCYIYIVNSIHEVLQYLVLEFLVSRSSDNPLTKKFSLWPFWSKFVKFFPFSNVFFDIYKIFIYVRNILFRFFFIIFFSEVFSFNCRLFSFCLFSKLFSLCMISLLKIVGVFYVG